ncbi:RseP-like zinc metalloprotease [Campylobacter avium LMG 24591]|uniref:Zinc metalloprotease n=1 Tax=Campylobacter avium LMG 24591 TaxID=522484 RepID=A0A222MWL9_9BACT|nr:RIP metalloprotease RseP [Campylobacter avium]ASQ30036.1 RseP-like zinc metalloprotease [Campylobacter avium LMG 24591]OYD79135.1 RseP-like zinc metalloprotease [Campylobacter avium]
MKSILALLVILALGFYFFSLNFVVTILCISFLIFFHELGHFLAAKHMGVKVEVFSIGFGQVLFQKTFKGTDYRLSALPLGGYVKLKGQDDFDIKHKSYDKDSYTILSPLKKIYILLAGPLFNIILAFMLYIIIGNLGLQKVAPVVGEVLENSAAQRANLQKGDLIVSIDGKPVRSFDEISKLLSLNTMSVELIRDDKLITVSITPSLKQAYNEFLQLTQRPQIGIQAKTDELITVKHTGLNSLIFAYEESLNATTLIVKALAKLVIGELDPKNLGGVITMADVTSRAADMGIVAVLLISALISINLGVVNLLPIPMLDGGHIVFNLYELVFKKSVPFAVFEKLSYVGLAFLLCLMVFATYNDIVRLSLN